MNTQPLEGIKAQLEEQNAKTAAKANTLRVELVELEEEVARINAALAALTAPAAALSNGKPSKKQKKKGHAPAATKAQVVALISEQLSQHTSIEEDELKGRIEKMLVDTGHSLMGFSLRFKEALADSRFAATPEGVSMKSKSLGVKVASITEPSVVPG